MADLKDQHGKIEEILASTMREIFTTSAFIAGRFAGALEEDFGRYTGAESVVPVGNGTDALEIILSSLELHPGAEVLVPANSFVATAEAVVNSGYTPVFVDVTHEGKLDFRDAESKISPTTSALVLVHLWGRLENVAAAQKLSSSYGLKIIEDCAQAHGTRDSSGQHVGTFFQGGAFSFYPGKNLGAAGDAGAIIFGKNASPHSVEIARRIANHGRLGKFDHDIIGRNSRMDELQAAVLLAKLPLLDSWINDRRRNATRYLELFDSIPQVRALSGLELSSDSLHQFVVRVPNRDRLAERLANRGIQTGVHYPKPICDFPAFRDMDATCEVASALSEEILSLPVSQHLGVEDIDHVFEAMVEEL